MLGEALAVLGVAAACGAWVALQRFIARHDPDNPGLDRGCDGCAGDRCRGSCEAEHPR